MSPAKNERRQKKHPNLRRGAAPAKNTKKTSEGRKWKPGQSGNPRGRPPGVPNKATREVKVLAQSILEDPLVQQRMLIDAQKGRLPPPVMTMLFHYAYGKPKDTLRVEGLERLEVIVTDDIDVAGDVGPGASDAAGSDT